MYIEGYNDASKLKPMDKRQIMVSLAIVKIMLVLDIFGNMLKVAELYTHS